MASFLSTLSLSARTAYPIIQRATRMGLTVRGIQSAIRDEFGRGISNTVLGQIVRRERDLISYASRIESLPGSRPINVNRIPEALTRQRRRFNFVVEVDGMLANGVFGSQRVTVSSDRALTPNQIRELAEEAAEFGGEKSGVQEIEGSTIISATRLGSLGRL
jgi:hypothetical protein